MRVNRRIRAREVRVIDADGRQLGIMPPELALQKALDSGLDLVEVSPDARPPVCKIIDYGKYKYQLKKKANEAKKRQGSTAVKEVKFRPKIEKHDYDFKVNRIRRFLGEGHKTKVTMMFRGRELAHANRAKDLMLKIAGDADMLGVLDLKPKLEGRNMTMMLSPVKGFKEVWEQMKEAMKNSGQEVPSEQDDQRDEAIDAAADAADVDVSAEGASTEEDVVEETAEIVPG